MALEICVVDRPHLNPLPRGEDFTNHACRFAIDHRANPAAGFSKDAANVKALSLGRGLGEGGRLANLLISMRKNTLRLQYGKANRLFKPLVKK